MKNLLKITQDNIFKSLEWIFYLILCTIALTFMKDVFIKFNSGDSSFKQYESITAENPTITLCLNDKFLGNYSWYEHKYGKDVNIYYYIGGAWVVLK